MAGTVTGATAAVAGTQLAEAGAGCRAGIPCGAARLGLDSRLPGQPGSTCWQYKQYKQYRCPPVMYVMSRCRCCAFSAVVLVSVTTPTVSPRKENTLPILQPETRQEQATFAPEPPAGARQARGVAGTETGRRPQPQQEQPAARAVAAAREGAAARAGSPPVCIPTRQVGVHRNNMHAAPCRHTHRQRGGGSTRFMRHHTAPALQAFQ